MTKNIFTFFICFFVLVDGNAQDIHFSQASETPMIINPAATGVFDGWERVTVNHKNQWVNAGTRFFTTAIAADLNLFKPRRGKGAYMGLGIQFYNDIGGDSKFGTRLFAFSFSGVVPLGGSSELSAGIQTGVAQKFGDFSTLQFANQFNGEGFDANLQSGEINNLATFAYGDFSAGLMYRFNNKKIGFSRDDGTDFRIGAAYFHVNQPELNYRIGTVSEKLYGKLVIHTSIIKDFDGTKLGVNAYINEYLQGPHNEFLIGALLSYRLQAGGKITGLNQDSYLSFGAALRVNDAFIPTVKLQYKSFSFGMSYDITVSKFGQYYRAGGLEFSLSYANLDFALFKRR
ncbi:MAG: PorP/SprF family type IX secretion system membrane protein [Putridiphycobacter sp.]